MDSTNSESRSRSRGKRKAVVRLLLYALPHLHLFIPALLCTAVYTGMTTARAGSVYILLRLAGQFEARSA